MSEDNKERAGKTKSQMMKISLISLLIVLLFMIEMYEIINDPANMIVISTLGVFLLVSVYVEMLFIGKLAEKREQDQEESFDNVYRSEKASYLLMRKYFDQMEQKMENLGDLSNIPYKELIAAQKALAKAQINRNKQNTNALLISNDRMMQRLTSMQNDISNILENTNASEMVSNNEINSGLSEQDKAVFLEGNKDVLEKQQEILHNLRELESSLRNEILESANKVASMKSQQISVPQPQMQIQENEDTISSLDIDEDFSFADDYKDQEEKQSFENSTESNLDRLLQQVNVSDSLTELPPMMEESVLQPTIEEPELNPIMEEPELPPITEESVLPPITEEQELQPMEEELVLQPVIEEPELQLVEESTLPPMMEEPEVNPIMNESELQPMIEEPELQLVEESILQPMMEEPEVNPIMNESELQPMIEEPELQLVEEERMRGPIIQEPDFQPVPEEPALQPIIEEPVLQQIDPLQSLLEQTESAPVQNHDLPEAKMQLESIAEKFQPGSANLKAESKSIWSETKSQTVEDKAFEVSGATNEITPDKLAAMVANLGTDMQIEAEPVVNANESEPAASESSDDELEKIMKAMDIEDVSGDSLEDLDIDKILEVPISNQEDTGNSNQVMSSEEIAALIANTELLSEPTAKDDDIMDLSDPRHVMSSDEIAALIANM